MNPPVEEKPAHAEEGHDAVFLKLMRIVGHHVDDVPHDEAHANRHHGTVDDVLDLQAQPYGSRPRDLQSHDEAEEDERRPGVENNRAPLKDGDLKIGHEGSHALD